MATGKRPPNVAKSLLYGIERFFKPVFLLKPVLSHCAVHRAIRQFPIFYETNTEEIALREFCGYCDSLRTFMSKREVSSNYRSASHCL